MVKLFRFDALLVIHFTVKALNGLKSLTHTHTPV